MRRISHPELFFGFVAPIGAELDLALDSFERFLKNQDYRVIRIKVTDIFPVFEKYIEPGAPLERKPAYQKYTSYIKYGNQLRKVFDDAFLAATAVGRIVRIRNRLRKDGPPPFEKTAFLLHQFKRKEEIELLRSVYGRLFFQVSVYSRRGARVHWLARKFGASESSAHAEKFRAYAEEIVQKDEDEVGETHGQRVGKIFHDADLIINVDTQARVISEQVDRFCEILFSSNRYSPSKMEYGMFAAKAAALRSLDLSRQVGAAIFSEDGEITSMGCNEVPKARGGGYWADGPLDARDWTLGGDPNDDRKKQLLTEVLRALRIDDNVDEVMKREEIRNTQFMDALEYGRVVHAEMSALSDAAGLGRPVRDGVLFCTTFPCHICAKHIVAAGLARVVFLEPYPKSLVSDLHPDSIEIEGSDRGIYQEFPSVKFEHFFGITPRRYRELFERASRKTDGVFEEYATGGPKPLMDIKAPFYFNLEEEVMADSADAMTKQLDEFDGDTLS